MTNIYQRALDKFIEKTNAIKRDNYENSQKIRMVTVHVHYLKFKHRYDCGQAIDWSDREWRQKP